MRVIDVEKTSEAIHYNIKGRGFTFKKIAEEVGVNPQAVYKWSYGTAMPCLDNLVILSGILNVGLDDLIVTKEV